MANLPATDTGIDGTICICTASGSYGPRARWYPGRAGREEPCLVVTIERVPVVYNQSLPRAVADAAAGRVRAWVAMNHAALLDFWANGVPWHQAEVNDFIGDLRKLA